MRTPRDGRDGAPGSQGPQGKQGLAGRDGRDGRDIYELAVAKGFHGTQEEFLASLKGERGPQGQEGKEGPIGPQGPAGKDGAQGRHGIDGEPGRTGKAGPVGPQGPRGPEGPMGPMPKHYWDGTTLYFEQPTGGWDAGVDLKGPAGKSGRDGIGGGQGGVEEAPIDGSPYWRKDGGWVLAVTGGSATWGAIVGNLADQTDLGTAAAADTTDFATAAQGAKADTATQPADIADFVSSTDVTTIVQLTQAAYDALSPPDSATFYIVVG